MLCRGSQAWARASGSSQIASEGGVPEGRLRVARRFNAGCRQQKKKRPVGTLEPAVAKFQPCLRHGPKKTRLPAAEAAGYSQKSLWDCLERKQKA